MSRDGAKDGGAVAEGGGLSRWSRLKAEARARERSREPSPDEQVGRVVEAPPADAPDYEAMPDAEALEALGLPDPDSIRRGDDVKAFLAARVPARLRARALRSMWRSDPVFAVLDGLNDYDEDFTSMGAGPVSTLYQVGRGFLREEETGRGRKAAEAEAEAAAGADADAGAGPETPPDRSEEAAREEGAVEGPTATVGRAPAAGEEAGAAADAPSFGAGATAGLVRDDDGEGRPSDAPGRGGTLGAGMSRTAAAGPAAPVADAETQSDAAMRAPPEGKTPPGVAGREASPAGGPGGVAGGPAGPPRRRRMVFTA
ncbi:DUF3306 domain-containing protein [Rubrimonas cliftonensis]|uniref:DUF3306 domain-containing protein n=1 Tax=Rubrimonas cliftonensis TaxID=89524 RepID=A0A1H4D2V1_9RHOB|nr:DUF3306 domain-containing protein [Rubrimonas cliftonensis]SEA66840.1 Protein of unknown function [Rubrimonas cliftonensis]